VTFTGEVIEWRWTGAVPVRGHDAGGSEDLKEAARGLIHWGRRCRSTSHRRHRVHHWALFPRDGRYLVPVKVAVQGTEAIGEARSSRWSCVLTPRAGNDEADGTAPA